MKLPLTTIAAVLLVGCGPPPPDISIHDAAKKGNIEAVKQHLAAGTEVDAKNTNDWTPLLGAAYRGHKEIVELLIAEGANVNAKDKFGSASLHKAAGRDRKEIVELLIAEGADVNAKMIGNMTPLHVVRITEVAELLIKSGAEINALTHGGETPLHGAAHAGRKAIVELLIAKGADVNAQRKEYSITPLDRAKAAYKNSSSEIVATKKIIVELLRKHGGKTREELKATKQVAESSDISLWKAAHDGNIEAVKQHLAAGADVNANDWGVIGPLHRAAMRGHKEIAELLIAEGADVNTKVMGPVSTGLTPLHLAASAGKTKIVELLITAGAEVNERGNPIALTPLQIAIESTKSDIEVIELLIANGANVNAERATYGFATETTLDLAKKWRKPEIADLLRKHGAKTGEALRATKQVAAPSDISIHDAAETGDIEAVKQAIANGADVNGKDKDSWSPLNLAALEGHKEVVEFLIAKGVDVNAKDEEGRTPLHLATSEGYKEVSELLIVKGADVNAKDVDGDTPLDLADGETVATLRKHGGKTGVELLIYTAIAKGNIKAVKQHLAAGTDVNAKDKKEWTPLFYAAFSGRTEVAELLITKGADVNAKGLDGWTALLGAAMAGHKEIAELLIKNGADVNAKYNDGITPLDWANGTTADLLRKHGGKTGEELRAEGK